MRFRPLIPLHVLLLTSFAWAQSGSDPIAQRLAFVSESTYTAYLKGLEAFGTRHALQPNRDSVASWIVHAFHEAGLADVVADSFRYDTTRQWNIIATIPGSSPSAGDIVVGGHYDSQSSNPLLAPGADDNASGTAAVLEMARAITAGGYQPRHTLRFVAFGAEEMGLIGSQWYTQQLAARQWTVALMLNFDMIGTRRQDTTDRDVSLVYYEHAMDEANRAAATMMIHTTLTPVFTTQHRPHSDSWPFALYGIKCVFYIERDFSLAYHSPRDSSHLLDLAYASDIVRAGLAMLLASDLVSVSSAEPPSSPSTWGLEQNYPNPFNHETVIAYRVTGEGTRVRMTVVDLLGRVCATLVDGEVPSGRHQVRWSASTLPSGMYIVRYEEATRSGQANIDRRRMVLLR